MSHRPHRFTGLFRVSILALAGTFASIAGAAPLPADLRPAVREARSDTEALRRDVLSALSLDVVDRIRPSVRAPTDIVDAPFVEEVSRGVASASLVVTAPEPGIGTQAQGADIESETPQAPLVSVETERQEQTVELAALPDAGMPIPSGVRPASRAPVAETEAEEVPAVSLPVPSFRPAVRGPVATLPEPAAPSAATPSIPQELIGARPAKRPASIVRGPSTAALPPQEAKPQTQGPAAGATLVPRTSPYAVLRVERPPVRPKSLAVRRSAPEAVKLPEEPKRTAPAPSGNTVAELATMDNAIDKDAVNLIGVFGKDSSRRALVRLPSGKYVQVKRGQSFSGWQVSAIGDDSLRITKGGRNATLRLP